MNDHPISSLNFDTYTCKRSSIWKYDTKIFNNNQEFVGEVIFNHWGMMRATVKTPNDCWSFHGTTLMANEISVFEEVSGDEIAILEGNFSMNYTLRLRNHPAVRLKFRGKMEFWKMRYVWVDDEDHEWVLFDYKYSWTGYKVNIHVNRIFVNEIEPMFLAGIGIYLLAFRKMYAGV